MIIEEKRCKHGIIEIFCATCNPKPQTIAKRREPRIEREKHTVHGSRCLLPGSKLAEKYVIVHTVNGKEDSLFSNLGKDTIFVHIDGNLFLWAVERILELAPNLETIQIIPPMKRKLTKGHLTLCEERGVKIVFGHWRPDLAWKEHENRSPFYKAQGYFFTNLEGEQKKLFEELLLVKSEPALMASRYFCLNGEDFMPQWQIAREFGYTAVDAVANEKINAVIRYLDPTFVTGKDSIRRAELMKAKVLRIRSFLAAGEITATAMAEAEDKVRRAGLKKLPSDFPLARLDELLALVLADRDGRLSELERKLPSPYWAVVYRFGLLDFQYRTLEVVGGLMNNITRERVRQLEETALKFVDVSIDE